MCCTSMQHAEILTDWLLRFWGWLGILKKVSITRCQFLNVFFSNGGVWLFQLYSSVLCSTESKGESAVAELASVEVGFLVT